MIGVVNYGAGNLHSVHSALKILGEGFVEVREVQDLAKVDIVLLPGVGSFANATENLNSSGLLGAIRSHSLSGGGLVGICLGMQLLFESSTEGQFSEGLGLLKGEVVSSSTFSPSAKIRIGWDPVHFLRETQLSGDFFFAHSYEVASCDQDVLIATTQRYGRNVISAVHQGRVIGFQFHPEKSGRFGLTALQWAINSLRN